MNSRTGRRLQTTPRTLSSVVFVLFGQETTRLGEWNQWFAKMKLEAKPRSERRFFPVFVVQTVVSVFCGFFYPTEYGCSLADYDDILSYVFLPEKTGSY